VACVLMMIARRVARREGGALLRDLTAILGAAAVALAPCIVFFWWHGALAALWDQTIGFNAIYSEADPVTRLSSLAAAARSFVVGGLGIAAASGWLLALPRVRGRSSAAERAGPLIDILVGALPLEVFFASLSGRGYDQYFIPLMPLAAVGTAWSAVRLHQLIAAALPVSVASGGSRLILSVAGLAVLAVVGCASLPSVRYKLQAAQLPPEYPEIAAYLRAETAPTDTVGVWGDGSGAASVLYLAQRRSPTRYVYQQQLKDARYARPSMVDELHRDLARARPRIILATERFEETLGTLQSRARGSEVRATSGTESLHEWELLVTWLTNAYELRSDGLPHGQWLIYSLR
jgi:hypothetical protein